MFEQAAQNSLYSFVGILGSPGRPFEAHAVVLCSGQFAAFHNAGADRLQTKTFPCKCDSAACLITLITCQIILVNFEVGERAQQAIRILIIHLYSFTTSNVGEEKGVD